MIKNKIWTVATVFLVIAIAVLGILFINQRNAYATTKENEYNMAFYEVKCLHTYGEKLTWLKLI